MATESPHEKVLEKIRDAFAFRAPMYRRHERAWQYDRFGEPDPIVKYEWQSRYRVRTIGPNVKRVVAKGISPDFVPFVYPRHPQAVMKAMDAQDILDWELRRLHMEDENEDMLRALCTPGFGLPFVGWNPFENETFYELWDSRTVAWDTGAVRFKKSRWVAHELSIPRDILESVYGSKDGRDVESADIREQQGLTNSPDAMRAITPTETITDSTGRAIFPKDGSGAPAGIPSGDMVKCWEVWRAPYAFTDGEEATVVPGQRMLVSGDRILEDWTTVFYPDDISYHIRRPYPFSTRLIHDEVVLNDRAAAGPSGMVEQLMDPECAQGAAMRMFLDHLFLECRPWLMVSKRSDVTQAMLRDPNHFLQYADTPGGKTPQWLQAQALSGDFPVIYRFIEDNRDFRSGIPRVSRGEHPGEVRSGVAIQALQEPTEDVVSLIQRHHLRAFADVCEMILERASEFWTEERVIRRAMPEMAAMLGMGMHPEQLRDMHAQSFRTIPGQTYEPYGEPEPAGVDEAGNPVFRQPTRGVPYLAGMQFDVEIKLGPRVPVLPPPQIGAMAPPQPGQMPPPGGPPGPNGNGGGESLVPQGALGG